MPNLFIIAGCNGAGKTTASYEFLPEFFNIERFINADEIAREIAPESPELVAFAAGRNMLTQVRQLIGEGKDFAFETTLSSRSFASLCEDAKAAGYLIYLIFYWLESPAMALDRVRSRVAHGGHHVPDDVVVRRYYGGLKNLLNLYRRIVDYWLVFDSSGKPPEIIVRGSRETGDSISKPVKWIRLQNQVR